MGVPGQDLDDEVDEKTKELREEAAKSGERVTSFDISPRPPTSRR